MRKIWRVIYFSDKLRWILFSIWPKNVKKPGWFPYPTVEHQVKKVLDRSTAFFEKYKETKKNKKVYLIHPRGNWYVGIIQAVLGLRLGLKGYLPVFVLVDSLPISNSVNCFSKIPKNNNKLFSLSKKISDSFKIKRVCIDELIDKRVRKKAKKITNSKDTISKVFNTSYKGYKIGEYCKLSVGRYFFRSKPDDNKKGLRVSKKFLEGAIILVDFYENLLKDASKKDLLLIPNGKFMQYRTCLEVATKKGLSYVSFDDFGSVGATGKVWVFKHNKPVAEMDLSDEWKEWKNQKMSLEDKQFVKGFIQKQPTNSRTYPNPEDDWNMVSKKLEIEDNKFDVLYTNLTWDSSALEKDVGFDGMIDWIDKSIQIYTKLKKDLVIRIHPVEAKRNKVVNREKVVDFINDKYKNLPINIKIVSPDSQISSYVLMKKARINHVYTSTLGIEGALRGIRMVVSGKAVYREKGFTLDVDSLEHLRKIVSGKFKREINTSKVELAKKFLVLYLKKIRIPLNLYQAKGFKVKELNFLSLEQFSKKDRELLGWLVERIIKPGQFILPDELFTEYMKQ